jgi:hypothetical protein
VALNGHHPKELPAGDGSRWNSTHIQLREDYDPNGPIVLVGLGPKSRHMASSWERDTLAAIRKAYPKRPVLYRPKPNRPFLPDLGVPLNITDPVDEVLRGASLVVCRHSNVGVDACIAGIPVVCESGAASLLYGNDLLAPVVPTREQRLAFLQRLAWLNWNDEEAPAVWRWIRQGLLKIPSGIG